MTRVFRILVLIITFACVAFTTPDPTLRIASCGDRIVLYSADESAARIRAAIEDHKRYATSVGDADFFAGTSAGCWIANGPRLFQANGTQNRLTAKTTFSGTITALAAGSDGGALVSFNRRDLAQIGKRSITYYSAQQQRSIIGSNDSYGASYFVMHSEPDKASRSRGLGDEGPSLSYTSDIRAVALTGSWAAFADNLLEPRVAFFAKGGATFRYVQFGKKHEGEWAYALSLIDRDTAFVLTTGGAYVVGVAAPVKRVVKFPMPKEANLVPRVTFPDSIIRAGRDIFFVHPVTGEVIDCHLSMVINCAALRKSRLIVNSIAALRGKLYGWDTVDYRVEELGSL